MQQISRNLCLVGSASLSKKLKPGVCLITEPNMDRVFAFIECHLSGLFLLLNLIDVVERHVDAKVTRCSDDLPGHVRGNLLSLLLAVADISLRNADQRCQLGLRDAHSLSNRFQVVLHGLFANEV